MGIHGGTIVKEDAILVEDIDLSLRRDVAKDVGGIRGTHHLVESGPVPCALPTFTLVEIDRGLGTHIELVPVKIGILGRLLDIDVVGVGGICRDGGRSD